jgi:hypothetical protein
VGEPPVSAVGPRGKIAVLLSGTWLYGTVNRGEFSRAIAPESHRTFKLAKKGWRAGSSSVVIVVGSHVAAWDWQTPAPARRKAKAASKLEPVTPAEISDEDREALAAHMAGVRA